MKFKAFMAMLLAGLLCVTAFSSCDDDEDEDVYGYQLSLELTDPGDLSTEHIAAFNTAFKQLENEFGIEYLSRSDAKKSFNESVPRIQKNFEALDLSNQKTIKITIGFFNTGTQKMDYSSVIEIKPKA